MSPKNIPIELTEYVKLSLPEALIDKADAEKLWRTFGSKILVDSPSFKNNNQWELTSQGYVGFISVSETLSIYLAPKLPIKNLFGMWEYAYKLKNFEILKGIYQAGSLQEFYSQLANVLAKNVIDRGRKGYYRAYISRKEDLAFIKGKMDIQRIISKPWEVKPHCSYQENTADINENQILSWTLYAILHSGFCSDDVLPTIRNAYRSIAHVTTLQPFIASDCLSFLYNRLNDDYQRLHAISRFFLENTGPYVDLGDRKTLPFIVDMALLFEKFVAEWLKKHLKPEYYLKDQEKMNIDKNGNISIKIDLVLYETASKLPVCVLDTKYKTGDSPSPDDLAQISFYALAKNCTQAVLIYPKPLTHPLDAVLNNIHLTSSSFSLDGDLETNGEAFLTEITQKIESIQIMNKPG